MGKMTVDAFVAAKAPPQLVPLVDMLRTFMRECVPSAREDYAYGMPVWKARDIVAYIIPTKKDITFGFPHGVRFEDRFGLLRGRGKSARHVKVRRPADVDREVLLYYVQQALAVDAA